MMNLLKLKKIIMLGSCVVAVIVGSVNTVSATTMPEYTKPEISRFKLPSKYLQTGNYNALKKIQTEDYYDDIFVSKSIDSDEAIYYKIPKDEPSIVPQMENNYQEQFNTSIHEANILDTPIDQDFEIDNTEIPSAIVGVDQRQVVTQPNTDPHRRILCVETIWQDGSTSAGNAWMIGPRSAVTAAHVIYDPTRGGWARDVYVYAAKSAGYNTYGYQRVYGMSCHSIYTQTGSRSYDYAVIDIVDQYNYLNGQQLGNVVGVFNYSVTPSNLAYNNTEITVNGYETPYNNFNQTIQRYMKGKAFKLDPTFIYYQIDTANTQSGSPVYLNDNNVVGIHAYGASGPDWVYDPNNPGVMGARGEALRITEVIKSFFDGYKY